MERIFFSFGNHLHGKFVKLLLELTCRSTTYSPNSKYSALVILVDYFIIWKFFFSPQSITEFLSVFMVAIFSRFMEVGTMQIILCNGQCSSSVEKKLLQSKLRGDSSSGKSVDFNKTSITKTDVSTSTEDLGMAIFILGLESSLHICSQLVTELAHFVCLGKSIG